jgi:glycosyltransferase involved in cell wall biosynthesis
MNIAINTRFLIKNKLEGMGRFTFEIFKRVVNSNPQHHFYFIFDRKPDPAFIFSTNVTPIVVLPPCRHPFLFYIWFEHAIPRVLKKHNIDLFISPDNFMSLNTTVKSILVVHDISYHHYPEHFKYFDLMYYKRFMPKYVEKADTIVTVSHFVKLDILDKLKTQAEKIVVIGNAGRSDLLSIGEKEKIEAKVTYANGKPYFIFVGAIHPRKNVLRLIEAFDIFKKSTKSDVQLLIIGRKAWKNDALEKTFYSLNYKNEIHFLNYVDDKSLGALIGGALALIYPSLFEGFGIPILEGFQYGIPVITSNTTSMPEVGKDAAIFINPTIPQSIANAMVFVEKNPDAVQKIVENQKKQLDFYNWDKSASLFSLLINQYQ